jgi:uncharacterized peroxidase-related enzyme
MSWIREIDIDSAGKLLKNVYSEIEQSRGQIANIFKVQSLNPVAMKQHLGLYNSLLFSDMKLSREDREIIAVTVSLVNECTYCITHHLEALIEIRDDARHFYEYLLSPEQCPISEKQKAMVNYSIKLTKTPRAVNVDDVFKLRTAGLDDESILNVNMIASYFNFVNRIALGLGVPLEGKERIGYRF